MKVNYAEYATLRAELMRDYAPINAQERMMVREVSDSWKRVQDARSREEVFFQMMTELEMKKGRIPDGTPMKDGAECLMFLTKPTRSYEMLMRAVRDAENHYRKAVEQIETAMERRRRRELTERKHKVMMMNQHQPRPGNTSPKLPIAPSIDNTNRPNRT